ncbi:MAG: hypothetical protein JSW05_09025, partial [Candidatus Thorarchaeota archaeon]
EQIGNWISSNVYETLFTYPFDSADTENLVPLLAESVDISENGDEYTFTLRQGVDFHDGTPFNASCVKYNIERLLAIFDPSGPAWMIAEPIFGGREVENAVYEYGQGSNQHAATFTEWKNANDAGTGAITVLDPYTVRVRLEYPYSPFLHALSYYVGVMISPTWVERHGGVDIGLPNDYVDTHACGTGPYEVSQWIYDDHITLVRNTNYWRAAEALETNPRSGSIDQITIRTNSDDLSRKVDLLSGMSDGCYWPRDDVGQIWDSESQASRYADIRVSVDDLQFATVALGFNMRDSIDDNGVLKANPFSDVNLRIACSYSFDYLGLIQSVYGNLAVQAQGPIPRGMFGHDDGLQMYSTDLDLAIEAWNLAMAGGLDSALAAHNYELKLYYATGMLWDLVDDYRRYLQDYQEKNRREMMECFRDGILRILEDPRADQPSEPLSISVLPMDWDDYRILHIEGKLLVSISGWAMDYADPDNFVWPFVYSTALYPDRLGLDGSEGWPTELVDEWIRQAYSSQDRTERLDLYTQIQQAIVDHVAYVWVHQPAVLHVERSNLKGYVFNPTRNGDPYFYNYWKEHAEPPMPIPNDTIIWETTGSPNTLDPHRDYEAFGIWISNNVYETLYTYPFDSQETSPLVPLLAESVEISPDGSEYTFTLREGITFHDGTPFNASCVKYNLERVMKIFDPQGPAWELGETLLGALPIENAVFGFGAGSPEHIAAYQAWVEQDSITVLDTLVVRVRLERPFAPFMAVLAYPVCAMVSPTWIESNGGIQFGQNNEYVDTHTCGTGPYMVTEYSPWNHITLTLNHDYWRTPSVHLSNPNAGSIETILLLNNDIEDSREANLLSGRTDGCFWPRADAQDVLDPETGRSLNPSLSVWSGEPTYSQFALSFNMRDYLDFEGVLKINPFHDKNLRVACSYAFDYANFIDEALDGLAVRGQG